MNIILTIVQWLFHSYEEFCELNLTYFKMFGLFQMVNPYNRVSNVSQKMWLYIHAGVTLFTSVHTVFQIIGVFNGETDYKHAMNKVTHIGNWTIAAIKFVNFAYNRHRLQYLFDVFKLDFLHVTTIKERKDVLYDHAYRCNWFILLYATSCFLTCAVWNIYPLAELIYYSLIQTSNGTNYKPKNILESWYPFDSTVMPIYYYIYVYEFVIYFYMLFAFCCYDSYLFSMFTMMKAQFEVLNDTFSDIGYDRPIKGYDPHLDELFLFRPEETLQNVRPMFKSICSESRLNDLQLLRSEQLLDVKQPARMLHMKGTEELHKAQEFQDSLLECTLDLQKANRYANELIEVYNDVIVFQVLVSIITICLMAFQTVIYFSTVEEDEFSGTFQISKSVLYFTCAFLLLFLSCLCSGDLNDARKEINAAFYNAHWHEFKLPSTLKRNILFSMTCGQKSHVVEITHRFPIDLHTFTEIAEVCFSYFTFLLNYYKKRGYQ